MPTIKEIHLPEVNEILADLLANPTSHWEQGAAKRRLLSLLQEVHNAARQEGAEGAFAAMKKAQDVRK